MPSQPPGVPPQQSVYGLVSRAGLSLSLAAQAMREQILRDDRAPFQTPENTTAEAGRSTD